jgi:hypothetical protein
VGVELKPSYFRQAVRNMELVGLIDDYRQDDLLTDIEKETQ